MHDDKSTRLKLLREVAELECSGVDFKFACERVGVSAGAVRRWRRAYAESGAPGLEPDKTSGRRAWGDYLSDEAKGWIKRKVVMCGSVALAYKWFRDDPLCPDELRAFLLRWDGVSGLPVSLRRAANVTPDLIEQYRGPQAAGHAGIKARHGDFVVLPDGTQRDLMAGDIFLSDDMSINFYFWFELPEGERKTRAGRGDKLAEKYGVAIGRQGLYTIDARGKWLGATLVGCAKDAYTSADVLRHFKAVTTEFGCPRLEWVLEKGVWKAKTISGERPLDGEERAAITGGLSSLGFEANHVHTSEGKALVEGPFNPFQAIMALAEDMPNIGRIRGEMEREAKLINRVQHGVIHPQKAGLLHINEMSEVVRQVMVWWNSNRKNGKIQKGIPDERWLADVSREPLARVPREKVGIFMPLKHETQLRQGHAEKKMGGDIFRFCDPEIFGRLGTGYRVLIAFDPSDPHAGAEVYNRETGARNEWGYGPEEWICHAEFTADLPLFGYSDAADDWKSRRKAHQRAFQSAYCGTGLFGKRGRKELDQRDGRGNAARIEVGGRKSEVGGQRSEDGMVNRIAAADRKRAASWRRDIESRISAADEAEEELLPLVRL
jgi:hypothetical protein